jgi:hypothetical protein
MYLPTKTFMTHLHFYSPYTWYGRNHTLFLYAMYGFLLIAEVLNCVDNEENAVDTHPFHDPLPKPSVKKE